MLNLQTRQHFISLSDIGDEELNHLLKRSVRFSNGIEDIKNILKECIVGIYFRKTSTRTRTAFSVAALQMGAQIISYGPNDLQENTGESYEDTSRVLSSMLDALVIRTASPASELRTFASQSKMSVINAMCFDEHPTQALADLTTMIQHYGELSGLRLLYIGEGNNTATALSLSLPRFRNCSLFFHTPKGYGLPTETFLRAKKFALESNSEVIECHNLDNLPGEIDVVYTTRWQTTGTSKKDLDWRNIFAPFSVTQEIMDKYSNAIFLHDLPAHRGEEVEEAVLDGCSSLAFKQAENKLHSAKSVLEWSLIGSR